MAVRSRHLAGPHELDGGVDGVGGAEHFGDARIDQRNRPPLAGTLDVDEVARLRHKSAHRVPAPQVRADAGALAVHPPQTLDVVTRHLGVQGFETRCRVVRLGCHGIPLSPPPGPQ